MKTLRPQKVFRISCCCCFIQLMYTCKCVKCIDILPGFTNKKQPKVLPGNTVQEISFSCKMQVDIYWATYFFSLAVSPPWQVNIFLRPALRLLKSSFTEGEPKDGLSLRNWLRLRGATFSGSRGTWCRIQPLPPCSAAEWHPIHLWSPEPPVELLHSSPPKRQTCSLLMVYL